jgi:hypothetical protein
MTVSVSHIASADADAGLVGDAAAIVSGDDLGTDPASTEPHRAGRTPDSVLR